ncbi:MAG: hypothetical protein U5K74_06100 [Gemmatimonadaceae bacterium]|nr:hypothetical protein [Gemmatimonadaceae bacterium]
MASETSAARRGQRRVDGALEVRERIRAASRLSPMMKAGVPLMPALDERSASLAISGRVACDVTHDS